MEEAPHVSPEPHKYEADLIEDVWLSITPQMERNYGCLWKVRLQHRQGLWQRGHLRHFWRPADVAADKNAKALLLWQSECCTFLLKCVINFDI